MTPVQPLDGFSVPTFSGAYDLEAHLARVPEKATIKGTIPQSFVDSLKAAGVAVPPHRNFMPFKDYSMRETLTFQLACARAMSPECSGQDALRRLGRSVFPGFLQTLVGKVMYGVFGSNLTSIFKVANKSFEITQSTGRVRTDIVDVNAVRLQFTNTHSFLSSLHLGILEGTLEACRVRGGVWFKPISDIDGDFYVVWDPKKLDAAAAAEQNAPSAP